MRRLFDVLIVLAFLAITVWTALLLMDAVGPRQWQSSSRTSGDLVTDDTVRVSSDGISFGRFAQIQRKGNSSLIPFRRDILGIRIYVGDAYTLNDSINPVVGHSVDVNVSLWWPFLLSTLVLCVWAVRFVRQRRRRAAGFPVETLP